MLIISKYKDYYDYLGQIYGVDNKIVYTRNHENKETDRTSMMTYEYTPGKNNLLEFSIRLTLGQIWFCDKNYPLALIYEGYGSTPFIYYDVNELLEFWAKRANWGGFMQDKIKDHFKTDLHTKLNSKYNCPQLLQTDNRVELDIILKDYFFHHLVSPEQAFQKVAMFVAAKPDPLQQIPTEMHRFEAKGFDKKTSFRKEKESK